jgi:hypothetical protein
MWMRKRGDEKKFLATTWLGKETMKKVSVTM